jgi:hypothetical protein
MLVKNRAILAEKQHFARDFSRGSRLESGYSPTDKISCTSSDVSGSTTFSYTIDKERNLKF